MKPGITSRVTATFLFSAAFYFQVHCETPVALSAPPPKSAPALLNSYLPAAMQVLAHITNQMKFEREPPASTTKKPAVPTTTTTSRPTTTVPSTTTTTRRPTTTVKTTQTPAVTQATDLTTPAHGPANFAPLSPPAIQKTIGVSGILSDLKQDALVPPIVPDDQSNLYPSSLLLPEILDSEPAVPVIRSQYPQNSPHYIRNPYPIQETSFPVILFPAHTHVQSKSPQSQPLFLPGNFAQYNQGQVYADWLTKARQGENDDEAFDISDGSLPDLSSLPVENENNFKSNPLELMSDELSDENLQFLAPNVREIIKGINSIDIGKDIGKKNPSSTYQHIDELYDSADERKNVGEWLRLRKASATQSYIQMLLLYDLLSRDAKSQKLNNYNGYTPTLIKDLNEASQGSAADQLKTILDRMVARGDCKHDFANNRAKELVVELSKPQSKASMEVRYLEPLRFVDY